jgi:hypothetical protein
VDVVVCVDCWTHLFVKSASFWLHQLEVAVHWYLAPPTGFVPQKQETLFSADPSLVTQLPIVEHRLSRVFGFRLAKQNSPSSQMGPAFVSLGLHKHFPVFAVFPALFVHSGSLAQVPLTSWQWSSLFKQSGPPRPHVHGVPFLIIPAV